MTSEQPLSHPGSWNSTLAPETFETLASPYLQLLSRWVRSRVPRSEDADDVIQQTLLLALRHIEQFRFEASFGTWLCRIALNVIRGRIRRPDYSRTVLIDPQILAARELKDPRQSALALLEKEESHFRLHRAISKLPEIYRHVIELRDLRGLSIHETAQSLCVSRPAVKSRHHRARNMLFKVFTESDPTTIQ